MCFARTDLTWPQTRFYESFNPTAARPSWKRARTAHPIWAVSCPSQRLCIAGSRDGYILVGTRSSRRSHKNAKRRARPVNRSPGLPSR